MKRKATIDPTTTSEWKAGNEAAKAMKPIAALEAEDYHWLDPLRRHRWLLGWYAGGGNGALGIVETPLMVLQRKRRDAQAALDAIDAAILSLTPMGEE